MRHYPCYATHLSKYWAALFRGSTSLILVLFRLADLIMLVSAVMDPSRANQAYVTFQCVSIIWPSIGCQVCNTFWATTDV
jgi:uncharacterized membrane protein YqjE